MNDSYTKSLKTILLFISCAIGLSLALGQKISLLLNFGMTNAIRGVILCSILLFTGIYFTMENVRTAPVRNFYDYLVNISGVWMAQIFHIGSIGFLFILFGVMGEKFALSFQRISGMGNPSGFILFVFVILLILIKGKKGVIAYNLYAIPIVTLLSAVFVIGSIGLQKGFFGPVVIGIQDTEWIIYSIIYAGYVFTIISALLASAPELATVSHFSGPTAIACSFVLPLSAVLYIIVPAFIGCRSGTINFVTRWFNSASAGLIIDFIVMASALCAASVCAMILEKSMGRESISGAIILCIAAWVFAVFDFSGIIENLYIIFGILGIGIGIFSGIHRYKSRS